MQSTESKDAPRMTESGRLIGPKEAIAIDTAPFSTLDQHYYQLWLRGSDTIDGLEAALAAVTAERDQALQNARASQQMHEDARSLLDQTLTERDELRKAVLYAPHGPDCNLSGVYSPEEPDCNCWKAGL